MEVRRAVQSDTGAITKLIGAEAYILTKRFGALEIPKQIEVANLCLVTLDSSGSVSGFASFDDHPLETTAQSRDWETSVSEQFNTAAFGGKTKF